MKTLKLTLKAQPFEVMKKGEKLIEVRKPSQWIKSRLFDKTGKKRDYDMIEFRNGYNSNSPMFTAQFRCFEESKITQTLCYTNGLTVQIEVGDFVIYFIQQKFMELNLTKRDGWLNRNVEPLPTDECQIRIITFDAGDNQEHILRCTWKPSPNDPYHRIGTAHCTKGGITIGFHVWKANNNEFVYYQIIEETL
jgi:hypothetical protein